MISADAHRAARKAGRASVSVPLTARDCSGKQDTEEGPPASSPGRLGARLSLWIHRVAGPLTTRPAAQEALAVGAEPPQAELEPGLRGAGRGRGRRGQRAGSAVVGLPRRGGFPFPPLSRHLRRRVS